MTETDARQVVKQLEKNVASPNFVYAVGYSLEKVHSGVLCHLLNHHKDRHRRQLAVDLWNALSKRRKMSVDDLDSVRAARERKVGPRTVVDLYVELVMKSGERRCVLCEYKVDGTQNYVEQCQRIKEHWTNRENGDPEGDACFGFAAMGGARFWHPPDEFTMLGLDKVTRLLTPYSSIPLVGDYLSALDDEKLRREIAPCPFLIAKKKRNGDLSALGFRGYDWWYAYYDTLRQKLPPDEWEICSGGHNAVMTWSGSSPWAEYSGQQRCKRGAFYCEFNNWDLMLKIRWKEHNESENKPWAKEFYDAVRSAKPTLSEDLGLKLTRRGSQAKQYSSWAKLPLSDCESVNEVASEVSRFLPNGFLAACEPIMEQLPE